jgi:uncharacterized protein (DUF608 family)
MPVFSSKENVKSGMPLGGIGAGKFEILPSGLWNGFTLQNNWSKPFRGTEEYPGILGYHLGVLAESADSNSSGANKKAYLLQTAPVLKCPILKSIRYEAVFPKATLYYEEPDLGLDLSLEVFSPWIPGDLKNSSLPAAFFSLRTRNRSKIPLRVSFIFIGRNICGQWCVGRQNRIVDEKKTLHLEFLNNDPSPRDTRQGALRFSFVKDDWQTSYMESWNAVTQNFSFNAQNISLLGWDHFTQSGKLPNTKPNFVAQGENQELCGAIAATQTLLPRAEKKLLFTACWYFPKHPLGHRYETWFKEAAQVSGYALPRRDFFAKKIKTLERIVYSMPFPRWFGEALLANLSPFYASTWYVRDGRFAFFEAPVICPLMGTLDVGFYGSIPLAYFFPELELSQISQFARAQRVDGYIPHDLGKNRMDMPSNGTTFHLWKDLNPKFILMVYRDFLWSGDRAFLKKIYPAVKKALLWTLSTDHDGNGLPDNEGADQTFDLWEFYGTSAYTSGIFLAALLACVRMGEILGDTPFAKECRERFRKGSWSFENELWNGSFFGETCALSQLNGQWYADLLGLGDIVEERKIKKALTFILKHNSRQSRFGLVNSVRLNGSLDASNDHSKNVWSGMNYAFLSVCVSRGFALNNLLKEAGKIWDNLTKIQKSPWDQPDTIDSKTGRFVFGDSYYRNMAIWSIPIMLAAKDAKTRKALKAMKALSKSGV